MINTQNYETVYSKIVSITKNEIKYLATNDLYDYATGFGAAFVITALKIGNWNLLASAGAVAAFTRSETLIKANIRTYCPKSISQNNKVHTITKIAPFVIAAAVYAGISALSLQTSLITLGSAIVINMALMEINRQFQERTKLST